MLVGRSLLAPVLAISIVAGASMAAVAQDEAGAPVGSGGRVTVPEAGFAITLPDDWTYVRPQASDVESIIDALNEIDPGLAALVEGSLSGGAGFSIALLGFAPTLPGAFAVNCNVVSGATNGLSQDFIVAANLAQLEALGWNAELTAEQLPVGEVARIDYDADIGDMDLEQTLWVYVDADVQHNLTCTSELRPEDGWRSIAETLEILPLE